MAGFVLLVPRKAESEKKRPEKTIRTLHPDSRHLSLRPDLFPRMFLMNSKLWGATILTQLQWLRMMNLMHNFSSCDLIRKARSTMFNHKVTQQQTRSQEP